MFFFKKKKKIVIKQSSRSTTNSGPAHFQSQRRWSPGQKNDLKKKEKDNQRPPSIFDKSWVLSRLFRIHQAWKCYQDWKAEFLTSGVNTSPRIWPAEVFSSSSSKKREPRRVQAWFWIYVISLYFNFFFLRHKSFVSNKICKYFKRKRAFLIWHSQVSQPY